MRIRPGSGLPDLDRVLGGIRGGDNVVWKVDGIASYRPFVAAFARHVEQSGDRVIYFRFARHEPVLEPGPGVIVHETHPEPGFESFITEIHRCIKEHGPGGCYVFDSLSDLSSTCYSDRMIGNFFRLTCPFLRSLDTIAFFAMYRYFHSYHAAQPIAQTTQILIDVYSYQESIYVQPSKVEGRRSPFMFMLHHWANGTFVPVKSSAHIAKVIGSSEWPGLASASYRMIGVWDKTFMRAESVVDAVRDGTMSPEYEVEMFAEVLRLAVSTDEHIVPLVERYLTLPDVIHIWKRMIGTGMIGGKSVGMLLARAILCKHDPKWKELLEPHDSFYIGSDVFYTFLVANDCWWERQRQKDPQAFMDGNDEVRAKILTGDFPDYIVARFLDMLDYFGQAPIIVRSSSLLEDNFGNAFSGKYDSVFCANQGTREERLSDFLDAVRRIYASTISDDALSYRELRGVLDRDEQMALLVQRVSGKPYGRLFYPQLAGVAYSFNPYAWSREIVAEAGMLRLVFGLGTRAVDRSDDDYTRVVPLNAPRLRPDSSADDRRRHSQRKVDVIDLERNEFTQMHFLDVVAEATELDVDLFASRDAELARSLRDQGKDDRNARVLALDKVLAETDFVAVMSEMLQTIRDAYGTHVDVEFTANFDPTWGFSIHLLQCRPLQVQSDARTAEARKEGLSPAPEIDDDRVIMRSHGGVIG
ncbi:MAG: pyruvate, phosphate dikinase, partial [Spirochaetaceae bacterium]